MITKKIELSTGETVTVAPVPNRAYDIVRLSLPYPEVPYIEDANTAAGESIRVPQPEDAEYKRKKLEIDQRRMEGWAEAQLLFGLPEVAVPDEWEPPLDQIHYFNLDWEPRQGPLGRRLDYIEWELLGNPADHRKVVNAINELASVDEEAVKTIEDSFRGDLEGEAA